MGRALRIRRIAFVTLVLQQVAAGYPGPGGLLSRPDERIVDDGAYMFDVPRGENEQAATKELADALPTLDRRNHGLIIFSRDPALAARIARSAFSACRPNSLLGLDVYCLVGSPYDSYLRPPITRTGATLSTQTRTAPDPSHPPQDLKPSARRMFYKAQADARRDIARNRLVFCGSFPSRPFQKLLRERYGIQSPIIHPYEVSSEDWSYDVGYNSISVPEIERRYGKAVLYRALIDSRKKAYARKRPNQAMRRTAPRSVAQRWRS